MTNQELDTQSTVIRSFKIKGLQIEHSEPLYKRFREPLVLCPGMWSDGEIFRDMMVNLSQLGHECIAISYRNTGKSDITGDIGKDSAYDYMEDLDTLLSYLEQKVVLVGNSMGGVIVAKYAEKNPTRVAACILMMSGPPRFVPLSLKAIGKVITRYWRPIWKGLPFKLTAEDNHELMLNTLPFAEAQKWERSMKPASGTAAREALSMHVFRRLRCPALVIRGMFDTFTPNQKIIARMLGADFEEVPCCHLGMIDPNMPTLVSTIHRWLTPKFTGMSRKRSSDLVLQH